MKALNNKQIERKDFVDNTVFELICQTNPTKRQILWDIEKIGNVRDSLIHELQNKLGISEFEVYP